jgi:photosystem II stability/assembly factor-like uncharacterized protein
MVTNSSLDQDVISDIAVVNNGQVIYALGNEVFFYKSTDSGGTWKASRLTSTSAKYGGMAIDPQDFATIYLSAPGQGVIKSQDGGITWNLLASSPVIASGSVTALLHNPIQVDPINTNVVYYGTDHGMYISKDKGVTWSASTNGIASADASIRDLAVDPATPSSIFILAGLPSSPLADLYQSADGGTSWVPLAISLDAERIIPDPVTASIIYVYGLSTHAAYKSTDGGRSFTPSDAGTPTEGSSGGSPGYVSVSGPTGTMIPLKSSPNTFLLTWPSGGIYRTQTAAQTWSPQNDGISAFNGIALAFDPQLPTTVYLATVNGGGIFKSTDSGITWAQLVRGSVRVISVDPFDSSHLLAAAGGLIESHDGGTTWANISSSLPNPTGTAFITGINFHPKQQGLIFVGTTGGGLGLLRTSDGGATYSTASVGLSSTDVGGCIAVNPQNPQMLLIADGVGIATSKDGGNTWAETPSTVTCPFSVDAKSSPSTIYAAQMPNAYSAVGAKSTDFGKTWTTLSGGSNLVADPSTANSVFSIGNSGYSVEGWSPDAGVTWYPLLTDGLGQTLVDPGGWETIGLSASGQGLIIAPSSPQVMFVSSWTNSVLRFVVGP